MKENFLLLTDLNDSEIIIGINNIISIQGLEDYTSISVSTNVSNGESLFVKTISVKNSFKEIKSMLGF